MTKYKLNYELIYGQKVIREKKDCNLPLGNNLDSRNNAGEENTQRNMPVIVDNHPPSDKSKSKILKQVWEKRNLTKAIDYNNGNTIRLALEEVYDLARLEGIKETKKWKLLK